jgi:TM2 domain-containing membrane protein YozV
LPLGNFFCAVLLVSLIIFVVFLIVSWVTVVQDAQFVGDGAPSNTIWVSVYLPATGEMFLTVGASVVIDPGA